VIPLRDENPTVRKPVLTILIIIGSALVYFGPQMGLADPVEAIEFNLEWAAIPCELRTGDPLSDQEVRATYLGGDNVACVADDTTPERYPEKRVWLAPIVSMFLHGSLIHIAGNMWFLWIFGNNIEDRLGSFRFALFYLFGGIFAMFAHFWVQPASTIPVVGASGAIAAVMGAYVIWFPNAPVRTLIFYFLRDISAKWFLGIWFITQFFTGADSGVAWMAHVGGFVFGAVVALFVRATGYGSPKITRRPGSTPWDSTGGIGRGPLPHPSDRRPW